MRVYPIYSPIMIFIVQYMLYMCGCDDDDDDVCGIWDPGLLGRDWVMRCKILEV
jgi:hypothetical protein